METMLIVALWVLVFTGLVLAPFSRTPWLPWGSLAVWVGAVIHAGITDRGHAGDPLRRPARGETAELSARAYLERAWGVGLAVVPPLLVLVARVVAVGVLGTPADLPAGTG